jgi:hypothetical protein
MPVGARFGAVERSEHLEDHQAALGGDDPSSVKGAAVPGAFDLEVNIDTVLACAHKVRVQRLRMFVVCDGGPCSSQRLRRNETAKEAVVGTGVSVPGRRACQRDRTSTGSIRAPVSRHESMTLLTSQMSSTATSSRGVVLR